MLPGGGNSFELSGHTMVSTGFIKRAWLATIVYSVLFILFLAVLWRDRNVSRDATNLHLMFALACVTLSLVYHRVYDAVLVYPLLILEIVVQFRRGRMLYAGIAALFAVGFALPGRVWDAAGRALANGVGENSWIHLPGQQVPVISIAFFAMTFFSLVVALNSSPVLLGRNKGSYTGG